MISEDLWIITLVAIVFSITKIVVDVRIFLWNWPCPFAGVSSANSDFCLYTCIFWALGRDLSTWPALWCHTTCDPCNMFSCLPAYSSSTSCRGIPNSFETMCLQQEQILRYLVHLGNTSLALMQASVIFSRTHSNHFLWGPCESCFILPFSPVTVCPSTGVDKYNSTFRVYLKKNYANLVTLVGTYSMQHHLVLTYIFNGWMSGTVTDFK